MERKSAREIQESLTHLTFELVGIVDRLARLPEALPDSPRREAMEEGEIPTDVATEVLGAVECTLEDGPTPRNPEAGESRPRDGCESTPGL